MQSFLFRVQIPPLCVLPVCVALKIPSCVGKICEAAALP
jgi:hypothetical protein